MASSSSASGGAPQPAGLPVTYRPIGGDPQPAGAPAGVPAGVPVTSSPRDAPHQCLPLDEARTEAELTAAIWGVYERHAPQRIDNVPNILHKYQGQLHGAYAHILVKYGLAPSSVLDEKPWAQPIGGALQPAGVPLRIGTFNLGISQDMLMNTFVKKHRAKYQHIMERLVCEGELDVLACCEVGGHRRGPSAAGIDLAEALRGLAAVHRTVGAYTITYTTPMPPPPGSPAAALQRGAELQTEHLVVRIQTEPVVVRLDTAEADYAHKVDPHFVVTEFKVARDPLCMRGLTTLLVGQLHVRTPHNNKKSPSIEQRQRIVKAATDYLEMRQIGGAGQPAVPNVVLVGDPNLTGPLGRAIHQRAEGRLQ